MGKISIGKFNFEWGNKPQEEKASRVGSLLAEAGEWEVSWSKPQYKKLSEEGFLTNAIAFRCIEEVAKSVAIVPWKVFEKTDDPDKRKVIQDHPLNEVLERPNPRESWPFLMLKTMAYQMLQGESYLEKIGPTGGPNIGQIKEMYSHRPDRITPVPNKQTGWIKEFVYEAESSAKDKRWPIDSKTGRGNLLQLRSFHPTNEYHGASNIQPAARHIDISNSGATWNKSLLDRDARPGMIYTIIGEMTPSQFDDLEKRLERKFSGGANSGRNMIVTGESGTRADPYMLTPKDMDWLEGDVATSRKICSVFGVPPMLIGVPGDSTYANYKEARLGFWENTIMWHLTYLKGELNNWLFWNDQRLFIDCILDNIPALAFRLDMLYERVNKSNFMTINEKREMVGIPSMGPEGDVIYHPINEVPLGKEPTKDDMNKEGGGGSDDKPTKKPKKDEGAKPKKPKK